MEKTKEELALEKEAEANTAALIANPKTAEFLAQFASAELMTRLDAHAATIVANAREALDTQEAAAASLAGSADTGKRELTHPELNEYLRCSFLAQNKRPYKIRDDFAKEGVVEQTLTETVGSAGGVAVPDAFDAMVTKRNVEPSVIWPMLTVRPTSSDAVKSWEVLTYVTANTGTDAKSQSATSSDEVAVTEPTFGEISWSLHPQDARVPIHLNLLDDAETDVVQLCVDLVAESFLHNRETYPLTGNGATRPLGLLNAATGLTSSAVTSITTANVIDFVATLPQRWRAGYQPALVSGSELHFKIGLAFAKDIRSAQYLMNMMPVFKEAGNMPVGKLLIGDFSKYIVYQNRLMRMVQGVAPERWCLELVFQERWDGQAPLTDAFRIGLVTTY